MRARHTYVELELSHSAYNEITRKLREVGYDHAFMDDGAIDMHGLAVTRATGREVSPELDKAITDELSNRPKDISRGE